MCLKILHNDPRRPAISVLGTPHDKDSNWREGQGDAQCMPHMAGGGIDREQKSEDSPSAVRMLFPVAIWSVHDRNIDQDLPDSELGFAIWASGQQDV